MNKYVSPKGEGFGTRLAELRKAAGYTQEQLASELGIDGPAIARTNANTVLAPECPRRREHHIRAGHESARRPASPLNLHDGCRNRLDGIGQVIGEREKRIVAHAGIVTEAPRVHITQMGHECYA